MSPDRFCELRDAHPTNSRASVRGDRDQSWRRCRRLSRLPSSRSKFRSRSAAKYTVLPARGVLPPDSTELGNEFFGLAQQGRIPSVGGSWNETEEQLGATKDSPRCQAEDFVPSRHMVLADILASQAARIHASSDTRAPSSDGLDKRRWERSPKYYGAPRRSNHTSSRWQDLVARNVSKEDSKGGARIPECIEEVSEEKKKVMRRTDQLGSNPSRQQRPMRSRVAAHREVLAVPRYLDRSKRCGVSPVRPMVYFIMATERSTGFSRANGSLVWMRFVRR